MNAPQKISPMLARRLAVVKQGLDAYPETAVSTDSEQADKSTLFATIQQIGCLQIDPGHAIVG